MTTPMRRHHMNFDFTFSRLFANTRITGRRYLTGYAYPQNGNVHNPTPRYAWLLLVDGRLADRFDRRCDLYAAVLNEGDAYLEGAPTKGATP